MRTKSNELLIRCCGYPDIDVFDFMNWIVRTYFKIPIDYELYNGKYDVDFEFEVDDVNDFIYFRCDLIDIEDCDELNEDIKRTIRELNRGE